MIEYNIICVLMMFSYCVRSQDWKPSVAQISTTINFLYAKYSIADVRYNVKIVNSLRRKRREQSENVYASNIGHVGKWRFSGRFRRGDGPRPSPARPPGSARSPITDRAASRCVSQRPPQRSRTSPIALLLS